MKLKFESWKYIWNSVDLKGKVIASWIAVLGNVGIVRPSTGGRLEFVYQVELVDKDQTMSFRVDLKECDIEWIGNESLRVWDVKLNKIGTCG